MIAATALSFGGCSREDTEVESQDDISANLDEEVAGPSKEVLEKQENRGSDTETPLVAADATYGICTYRTEAGSAIEAIAILLGSGKTPSGESRDIWIINAPGMITDSRQATNSFQITLQIHDRQYAREIQCNWIAEISGTNLQIFSSKFLGLPAYQLDNSAGSSITNALCVIGDKNELNSSDKKSYRAIIADLDNGLPVFSDGQKLHDAQNLIPLINADGKVARWGLRKQAGSDITQVNLDLKSYIDPTSGPFEISAISSFGDVDIYIHGELNRGAAHRGHYRMILGKKSDLVVSKDFKDREILKGRNGEGIDFRSDSSFRDRTGNTYADFNFEYDKGSRDIELLGQLWWVERFGREEKITPFKPFEVNISKNWPKTLSVIGNSNFKAPVRDLSGASTSKYLSDAKIINLQGVVHANRTVRVGNRLAFVMKEGGGVLIYSAETSELKPLGSELNEPDVMLGNDDRHLYVYQPSNGVFEKWSMECGNMVSSTRLDKSWKVIGLSCIEASPDDYIVLLCEERMRFLSARTLESTSPIIDVAFRERQSEFDDFRRFSDKPVKLTYAASSRAHQGNAVMFNGYAPESENDRKGAPNLVFYRSDKPGAIQATTFDWTYMFASLYPYGGSKFVGRGFSNYYSNYIDNIDRPYQYKLANEVGRVIWKGARCYGKNETILSYVGGVPSSNGSNLLIGFTQYMMQIPEAPYGLVVHDMGKQDSDFILLGPFHELTGCYQMLIPDAPSLAKSVFNMPELGKIYTINAEGNKLYERKLNSQLLLHDISPAGFFVAEGGPKYIFRGRRLNYQMTIYGAKNPEVELVMAPEGAELSDDGMLSWHCPGDYPEDNAVFQMNVKNPNTNEVWEKFLNVSVKGSPSHTEITSSDPGISDEPAKRYPLKIIEVPEEGTILDKIEVDYGRLQIILTETPDKKNRIEILDMQAEAWRQGVELPAKPDIITANPASVFIVYNEKKAVGIRSIEDLRKKKYISLEAPIAGIGCSPDTTKGVLCLAERIKEEFHDNKDVKVFDGTVYEVRPNTTKHIGFSFVSPVTLKTLPIKKDEEKLARASYFFDRRDDYKPVRLAFSPEGNLMTMQNFLLDFGAVKHDIVVGVHSLSNQPFEIAEGGNTLYSLGVSQRYDRTEEIREGEVVYQQFPSAYPGNAIFRAVKGRNLDVGYSRPNVRDSKQEIYAEFRHRNTHELVFKVGPLPEMLGNVTESHPNHMEYLLKARYINTYKNKLITIGQRKRQLFVRDIEFPQGY